MRSVHAGLGERRALAILIALCAVEFANFVGNGVISPILPRYAESFGVSTALIGLLISIFGFARLVADVPTGYLSERIGRRALVIGGPLIVALGSVLSGLARSFPELLAYRFLSGIGSAIFTTVGTTIVADISTAANRGRFMGYYQGALLLGVSVGPAIGGLVAEPWGLRAPFFVSAAFTLLSAVVALAVVPETRWHPQPDGHGRAGHGTMSLQAMLPFLKDPAFLLISLILFGTFLSRTGSQNAIIPLLGYHQVGLSEAQVGLALTALSLLNLLALPLAGSMADRFGRKATIVPGVLLTGLGLILFAVTHVPWLYFSCAAFLGFAKGISGPAPNAYVADIAPADRLGIAMGLFRFFGDLGFVVGPVLLGWLADLGGYQAPLWANGVFMLALGALFWRYATETNAVPGRAPQRSLTT
jgi:DHA1 family multidrug resistance protein-like MFS transporter